MNIPQLQIQTTRGILGLQITKPIQEIEQPKATQSIQQPAAILEISTTRPQLSHRYNRKSCRYRHEKCL